MIVSPTFHVEKKSRVGAKFHPIHPLVTAAPAQIPQPLIDQLKPGGRLVIPVGGRFDVQDLMVIEKKDDGSTTTRRTIPVRFVPLTRDRP